MFKAYNIEYCVHKVDEEPKDSPYKSDMLVWATSESSAIDKFRDIIIQVDNSFNIQDKFFGSPSYPYAPKREKLSTTILSITECTRVVIGEFFFTTLPKYKKCLVNKITGLFR